MIGIRLVGLVQGNSLFSYVHDGADVGDVSGIATLGDISHPDLRLWEPGVTFP